MSLLKATTEIQEYYYNWYHGIQFSETLLSSGYGTRLLIPLAEQVLTCVLPSTHRFKNINGALTQLQVEYTKMVVRR